MEKRRMMWAVVGLLSLVSAAAYADDISGADRILCSAIQATICESGGECEIGPPWLWNIPQFVVVDFKEETLGTTKASGENRITPIKNLQRTDGVIFLQGVEAGRAFSFVIEEETGTDVTVLIKEGRRVSS